jgi:hypothetical protein
MNSNETLLEQYRRDPAGVIQRIDAAARRERARYIRCFLEKSAEALFGTRRNPKAGIKDILSGLEADSCS